MKSLLDRVFSYGQLPLPEFTLTEKARGVSTHYHNFPRDCLGSVTNAIRTGRSHVTWSNMGGMSAGS